MRNRLFRFVLLLLLVGNIAHAQSIKAPVAVTDMVKIRKAGDVEIRPDAQQAVFTVSSIEPDSNSTLDYNYQTHIWLVNLTGKGEPRLMDSSKENATRPAYSPSGEQIAYTKTVKGQSQIFIYTLATGIIHQLTHFRYGATNPKWSPDGRRIVFTSSIPLLSYIKDTVLNPQKLVPTWSGGKPGFTGNGYMLPQKAKGDPDGELAEIRAYLFRNETDKKAKVIDHVQFQGETATSSEIRLSHIFIVDTTAEAMPTAVSKGCYSFSNPFFAGNETLIVNAKVNERLHPAETLEEQVYVLSTDGSRSTPLLAKPAMAFSVAAVSPSGKWLVYQQSFPGTVNQPSLHIIDWQQPAAKDRLVNLDRPTGNVRFAPDEQYIYFVSGNNGGASLYKVSTVKGEPLKLTSEEEGITDYDICANHLVYAKTSAVNPSELFIADTIAKNEIAATSLNTAWLAGKLISVPQKVIFKNSQGMEVECWVMKPVNFERGKKFPLLLEMHGGPASMWGPGEESMWHEFQFFCGKGIGVVYCNPRGSTGYGERFLKANINDWGPGPASDVLMALKMAVAQGWADTSNLLISGGSYAGYLTTWIISHDHRFRAASSQRGVYDFSTFFGEANVWRMVPRYFGGYPWQEKVQRVLREQSPVNYVTNIHTPLLIFHGENDLRTGLTQSEMLYKSLKVLGRPVEYVQQPGASHELVRSGDVRQRIDQMLRTYEFFRRYIGN
ncbi:peptidase S9 [Niastella vici]|uniref:Peptidase S9 n=1 Tax=Niastella vici TaxID=1703345 RepID=A0A1V9FFS7_9BACT|nr:S9 family peptidase [Niastella vici]OQP57214.1 peptidase S9 [Niastella vici]